MVACPVFSGDNMKYTFGLLAIVLLIGSLYAHMGFEKVNAVKEEIVGKVTEDVQDTGEDVVDKIADKVEETASEEINDNASRYKEVRAVKTKVDDYRRRMPPVKENMSEGYERAKEIKEKIKQRHRWIESNHYKKYMKVRGQIRNAVGQFKGKVSQWREEKQKFMNGEISEEEYLNKTKEMILTGIDGVLSYSSEFNVSTEELVTLEEEVKSAESLDELREVYREVREKVRAINMEVRRERIRNMVEIYKTAAEEVGDQELVQTLERIRDRIRERDLNETISEIRNIRAKLLALGA